MDKKAARLRRARKCRGRIKRHRFPISMTVHRSAKHIYVQVISYANGSSKVLASA